MSPREEGRHHRVQCDAQDHTRAYGEALRGSNIPAIKRAFPSYLLMRATIILAASGLVVWVEMSAQTGPLPGGPTASHSGFRRPVIRPCAGVATTSDGSPAAGPACDCTA